jgi:hypothetical protein
VGLNEEGGQVRRWHCELKPAFELPTNRCQTIVFCHGLPNTSFEIARRQSSDFGGCFLGVSGDWTPRLGGHSGSAHE